MWCNCCFRLYMYRYTCKLCMHSCTFVHVQLLVGTCVCVPVLNYFHMCNIHCISDEVGHSCGVICGLTPAVPSSLCSICVAPNICSRMYKCACTNCMYNCACTCTIVHVHVQVCMYNCACTSMHVQLCMYKCAYVATGGVLIVFDQSMCHILRITCIIIMYM